jgi:hypothetical protein
MLYVIYRYVKYILNICILSKKEILLKIDGKASHSLVYFSLSANLFFTMYPVCFYLAILKSLKLLLNFTGKSRGIAVRFVLRVSCALFCYRFLTVALHETSTSRVFVDTTYLPLDVYKPKTTSRDLYGELGLYVYSNNK